MQQAGRRCAVGLAVLLITAVGGCGSTPVSSSGSSPSLGGTRTTVTPKSADRSSLRAQPAEVIDFTPVSASGAWAVTAPTAAPGSANRGIERTVNAGAAWSGVTPALPEGLSGRGFTAGDFLNRREAWVPAVSAQQVPKTAELFATTDGGHSWQDLGRLPPACYSSSDSIAAIPSVQFVDHLHGWCGVESGNGDPVGAMYRTLDGGRHWTALDGALSLSRQLPGQTLATMGWHAGFTSPTDGWATTGCPHSATGYTDCLWRSTDGGVAWKPVTLPPPPHSAGQVNLAGVPVGPGPHLAEAAYIGTGIGATDIYRSDNSGRTWRLLRPPGPPTIWQPSLVSGEEWKLIVDRRLLSTSNAGRTWRTLRADRTLTITDDAHTVPATTTFLSPMVGWFILGVEAHTVWRTTDGGTTWRPVPLPTSTHT